MKKIKKIIAEKWEDYIVVLLASISIVFALRDVVNVVSIPDFYAPYIIVMPIIIVLVLKLFVNSKKININFD